jgi:hypothetical protein
MERSHLEGEWTIVLGAAWLRVHRFVLGSAWCSHSRRCSPHTPLAQHRGEGELMHARSEALDHRSGRPITMMDGRMAVAPLSSARPSAAFASNAFSTLMAIDAC